jgi:asparagine synthase (glutamine-hydrolysing)
MSETIRGWLRMDLNLPFLNQAEILKEFDLIATGRKPFSWQVWRWINFSRWYGRFLA